MFNQKVPAGYFPAESEYIIKIIRRVIVLTPPDFYFSSSVAYLVLAHLQLKKYRLVMASYFVGIFAFWDAQALLSLHAHYSIGKRPVLKLNLRQFLEFYSIFQIFGISFLTFLDILIGFAMGVYAHTLSEYSRKRLDSFFRWLWRLLTCSKREDNVEIEIGGRGPSTSFDVSMASYA